MVDSETRLICSSVIAADFIIFSFSSAVCDFKLRFKTILKHFFKSSIKINFLCSTGVGRTIVPTLIIKRKLLDALVEIARIMLGARLESAALLFDIRLRLVHAELARDGAEGDGEVDARVL